MMEDLVDYSSSSDEDDGDENEDGNGQRTKLPVPAAISSMFVEAEELLGARNDDPKFHGNRVRTFPHQRGNWPSFVCAQLQSSELSSSIRQFLDSTPEGTIRMEVEMDPHLSFTKLLNLQHNCIEVFYDRLKSRFEAARQVQTWSFFARWDRFKVFVNELRTRTFVALCVTDNCGRMKEIVRLLDGVLDEFGLPQFYNPPEFHVTLMWAVGDVQVEVEQLLPLLNERLSSMLSQSPIESGFHVKTLTCKIGHKRRCIVL